ncbi:hypothetical protein CYMTET_53155 [Cymbomonas tetramitiformis]|uniref:Uncharacterized protein n=1 Tax=Cymbomonas tetramitiformis TaxID=36881 RepID=A0AAE0EQ16_9CHLO|nr:hypothetical protein CYMTET_53155 [Cymbomonas tetramitiformis]
MSDRLQSAIDAAKKRWGEPFCGFQVELNEKDGKEFPLQHRCLDAAEWKKNNVLESVLTTPYEVSKAMQGHTGCGLDKEFILASSVHADLTSDVVDVVSGVDATETWEDVHARSLAPEIQQFRQVAAQEISNRLLELGGDTLLALKMNPGIDTL